MQGIIDISKVVGTVQIDGQTHEVCAEADATFNRSTHELTVKLSSYLHSEEQTHVGETIPATWLPQPETIVEHVDAEEASAMAKDVFASWCRKVQSAVEQHQGA
jgi:hypothetical protein